MNAEAKISNSRSSAESAGRWDEALADANLAPPEVWQEPGYDARRQAVVGLLLGGLAGCTSLVLNVIGSVAWPVVSGQAQHPLRIIQVFLTFPFGEAALQLGSGLLLALGCVLYLVTGMLYGMVFVLAVSYLLPHAGLRERLIACSALAVLVWVMNFYLVLAWLQPLVFGGRWIIELVPWWVGGATHLVFGWTIALLIPLGDAISNGQRHC